MKIVKINIYDNHSVIFSWFKEWNVIGNSSWNQNINNPVRKKSSDVQCIILIIIMSVWRVQIIVIFKFVITIYFEKIINIYISIINYWFKLFTYLL